MTDRDRLIELIKEYPCMSTAEDCFMESVAEDLADYLLANGVIVPPCKVGQTVFYANPHQFDFAFRGKILSYSLDAAHLWFNCHYDNGLNIWHPIEDLGKTVFLTKEEAERALKEREKV